jgi:hypothetical protein
MYRPYPLGRLHYPRLEAAIELAVLATRTFRRWLLG